jgi:hypothetical protein
MTSCLLFCTPLRVRDREPFFIAGYGYQAALVDRSLIFWGILPTDGPRRGVVVLGGWGLNLFSTGQILRLTGFLHKGWLVDVPPYCTIFFYRAYLWVMIPMGWLADFL